MRQILLIFTILCTTVSLHADEGMWLLKELNRQNIAKMKELGFTFPTDKIYDENNSSLKDAVVIFGRGCTGVMVSNKGLLFTNHHCGYDDIQKLSAVEHDYLKNGFVSQTFEKEIPAPGLTVSFVDKTEDISEYINSNLNPKDSEDVRLLKVDSLSYAYIAQYEDNQFANAVVTSFFSENKYYLIVYKVFRDVRFVFAPPSSVGKFGGETDNWMWPRHTGDFSVFRVYADENNNPANYSDHNKPYTPKYSVPISIKGYNDKDYAMTIGFPGHTQRYMTSWGINQMVESKHKPRITIRGVKQNIWREAMNASDAIRIKYASKYAMSSNYWKNAMGMNEAIENLNVIDHKKVLETDFTKWISQDKRRKEKYGNTLSKLEKGYVATDKSTELATYFIESFINGAEITHIAGTYEYILEQVEESERAYTVTERLTDIYKDYEPELDREVLGAILEVYKSSVPEEYLPSIYTRIHDEFGGDHHLYADWLFKNTKFTNLETALKAIKENDAETLLNDPAIEFSSSIQLAFMLIQNEKIEYRLDINEGKKEFMAGLIEMNPNKAFYPDANFTQRLSYGSIGGYAPADAIDYKYYTTTKGMLPKIKENDPEFGVQQYIIDDLKSKNFGQYLDKDGTMHLNFLSNNDITGGNSGSPVFNGQAELIGLAFDGNWEALSGDIAFNSELQRCINVDIRYVLYMIDKIGKAPRLIEELSIKK